jgi:hypothetical protein
MIVSAAGNKSGGGGSSGGGGGGKKPQRSFGSAGSTRRTGGSGSSSGKPQGGGSGCGNKSQGGSKQQKPKPKGGQGFSPQQQGQGGQGPPGQGDSATRTVRAPPRPEVKLSPPLTTGILDVLSGWEPVPPPLWGTFCGHLEGEWLGQYAAYTPWGGASWDEPPLCFALGWAWVQWQRGFLQQLCI